MKRLLCALLIALLAAGCAALAENPATEAPEAEVAATEAASDATAEAPTPGIDPTAAPAEQTPEPQTVRIGFEDGFALELPEGWRCHPTTQEMADKGVCYCLSDAEGAGWLYVQIWNSDVTDMNGLKALIDRTTEIQTSGDYAFNGTHFVIYDLTEGDVSCCAALLNGRVLNLVFTPQSDADFMAVAAQILNTFELL